MTVLVVAAALVDDLAAPTRLLAARRTGPPGLAGRWELPGGKVEPAEPPLDALHRELREELGIAVTTGPEVPGPDDGAWPLRPDGRLVMRVWLAAVAHGEPRPLDAHDQLRWLGRGDLGSVAWLDGDLPLVDLLATRLVG